MIPSFPGRLNSITSRIISNHPTRIPFFIYLSGRPTLFQPQNTGSLHALPEHLPLHLPVTDFHPFSSNFQTLPQFFHTINPIGTLWHGLTHLDRHAPRHGMPYLCQQKITRYPATRKELRGCSRRDKARQGSDGRIAHVS